MGLFDGFSKLSPDLGEDGINASTNARNDAARALEEGMILEGQGRLDAALQRYDSAIQLQPDLARAHFSRGNILLDRGDAASALEAYANAVEHKPDSAALHYNIGNAQLRLEHADEAIAACRQAILLKPDFANAHLTLGLALGKLGLHREAIASLQRAAGIEPKSPEIHNSLAIAMMGAGRIKEAIARLEMALALNPNYADAHHNRGIAFQDLGQFEEAILAYGRALDINPRSADAHTNLGSALKELGRYAEAETSYKRALQINPTSVETHYNLGVCLQASGRFEDAAACYQTAGKIDPNYALAHTNLGGVLGELGQYEAALVCFRRVIEIRPLDPDAHLNLGTTLTLVGRFDLAMASFQKALAIDPANANVHVSLGGALKDVGRLDDALESTQRALELDPDCAIAHNNLLFIYNYAADHPAAVLLANAQRFGEMAKLLARPYVHWPNLREPGRCLRVGFVSGDLCDHPVGYFLEGILVELSAHARGRVQLFAYSNRRKEDSTSQRIKSSCTAWNSVELLTDEALARRIREDGIDILIDLSGHTAHNRLPMFAWKPAPVQVSWLGYFATTGVAAIDYFIADPWTLLPEQESHFSEQVWRLPETRLCFTPPVLDVDVGPLPALQNGYVTFGCFNNLSKMNDDVVALWARVLNAVPGSRLFLKYQQLAESSVRQSTCARFAVHGVVSERLIFEDYVPRADYLAAYQRVDIALDPFPFPGGTTTVEALWMGIPVLTLAGERFLSRQGVGLLMNAGLPEWVATDPQDYLARAVTHASDLQTLAALRSGLRQQVLASPIYDATRFAQHFESALRNMWHIWCDKTAARNHNGGETNGTF
jgi:protein O-GlcNAc transferase